MSHCSELVAMLENLDGRRPPAHVRFDRDGNPKACDAPKPRKIFLSNLPPIACGICGTMFVPRNTHSKYCSTECSQEANRRSAYKSRCKEQLTARAWKTDPVACAWCRKLFVRTHKNQVCCCDECRDARKQSR